MAGIAAEACEMLAIRSEVGNSGIDHPACALHQSGQARTPTGVARRFGGSDPPRFRTRAHATSNVGMPLISSPSTLLGAVKIVPLLQVEPEIGTVPAQLS
jgi:hypothetical protein